MLYMCTAAAFSYSAERREEEEEEEEEADTKISLKESSQHRTMPWLKCTKIYVCISSTDFFEFEFLPVQVVVQFVQLHGPILHVAAIQTAESLFEYDWSGVLHAVPLNCSLDWDCAVRDHIVGILQPSVAPYFPFFFFFYISYILVELQE